MTSIIIYEKGKAPVASDIRDPDNWEVILVKPSTAKYINSDIEFYAKDSKCFIKSVMIAVIYRISDGQWVRWGTCKVSKNPTINNMWDITNRVKDKSAYPDPDSDRYILDTGSTKNIKQATVSTQKTTETAKALDDKHFKVCKTQRDCRGIKIINAELLIQELAKYSKRSTKFKCNCGCVNINDLIDDMILMIRSSEIPLEITTEVTNL